MRCSYLSGTLVAILACSGSTADEAAGSGGEGAGGTSTGACTQPPVPASEVTSRDACRGAGCGGLDCPSCNAITVELSQALPREGLTATIATSNDDLFVGCEAKASLSCEPKNSTLVERLVVALSCGDSLEEASSFHVEVSQQGAPIGAGDFDHPTYSCVARTVDDWCWEADPVVLMVSP